MSTDITEFTIISTGDELLNGSITDTNGSHISNLLYQDGYSVKRIITVGDDRQELASALRSALAGSDGVIITGGLGPTDDDITIEALQDIYGFTTVIDEESRERMFTFFSTMGRDVGDNDLKMVEVPVGSQVLHNNTGLAPGFILDDNHKAVIALPGVPMEMADMLEKRVLPYLRNKYHVPLRTTSAFRVVRMKESDVNALVKSMKIDLRSIRWGITSKGGIATVTFEWGDGEEITGDIIYSEAQRLFGDVLLGRGFSLPEEEVLHLMRAKGISLSLAESCTGGLLSKRITDIPGSSDVLLGAVVAYSNDVKRNDLNVSAELLSKYGAVSEEVAAEMAVGVREKMGAHIGISTTGIAGPGGGTDIKPVGMVCFGLSCKTGVKTTTRRFGGTRDLIRSYSALFALEMLRGYLRGSIIV